MSRILTQSNHYQIQNSDSMESITEDSKLVWNKLWLYPSPGISKSAASGTKVGLPLPNQSTVYVGEITSAEKATPDPLNVGDPPIKYQLPPGETKLLRDVIVQGVTVGDGVWFKYWPA